jgi:hypothetical protein
MAIHPRSLHAWFPITRILSDAQRDEFDRLVGETAHHPSLIVEMPSVEQSDIREVSDCFSVNLALQRSALIIAAHLAETFFFRRDILELFLKRPKRVRLYESAESFAKDGGVGGGCYEPKRICIQLLASRLTEGFGGETPGAAPFLHELGHMLDHFNPRTGGTRRRCNGLLPGLHPDDGDVFTPLARSLFIEGKRIERERYLRWKNQTTQINQQQLMPIGHPYVFQNDGEFCAGYFEMFFRNPNSFARQNETLYQAYATLFKWDPREAWQNDFAFYVEQNRAFYLSGQPLWKSKLTIPQS